MGVAGGVKEKNVKIGDVVAVNKAYGYESGKAHDTGFLTRPEVGIFSHRLVERAKAEARKRTWLQRIPGYPHLPISESKRSSGLSPPVRRSLHRRILICLNCCISTTMIL